MGRRITPQELRQLVRLAKQKGAITPKDVADSLSLPHREACRLLGLLEYKGLLQWIPNLPRDTKMYTTPELAPGNFGFPLRRAAQAGKPLYPNMSKRNKKLRSTDVGVVDNLTPSRREQLRENIRDVYKEVKHDPGSVLEISEATLLGRGSVDRCLKKLARVGKVVSGPVKSGKRGRPTVIWAANEADLSADISRRVEVLNGDDTARPDDE